MKQVKRIAIAVVCTILFFWAFDFVGGLVCDKLYHDAKYSLFARQNYVINKSMDEILVLGSSRAAHHYIPSIIEDSLGMSCYNAGSDGMCIYYHFGILSAMIERGHKPKMVICEVIKTDIQPSLDATFSLDAAVQRLAPEYGRFEDIDSLISLKNKYEQMLMHSAFYRYNSKLVQLIRCNFIPQLDDKGYERLNGVMVLKNTDEEKASAEVKYREPEANKMLYFNKLISLCKANNIALVFVYSPKYNGVIAESVTYAQKIAEENSVPFYNYGNAEALMKPDLFQDRDHLNHDGAIAFTRLIIKDFKKGIIDGYPQK